METVERKREGPSLIECNTSSEGPQLVAMSPSVLQAVGVARRYHTLRTSSVANNSSDVL